MALISPQQRLDHFVKLVMEAWDVETRAALDLILDDLYDGDDKESKAAELNLIRDRFEAAARERLSQGVQAWASDHEIDREELWKDAMARAERAR